MARVAGERSIPLESTLYDAGVGQFERNLGALLDRYRAADVPVFVGTVASNERDQPPLAVLAGDDSSAAGAAKTAYHAAQDADAAGNVDAAREGYAWARDLDPLRFRAPSRFNEVVREVAAKHGATVVDVQGALAGRAKNGIVGADLMLEHVHPNLEGYFLLSEAYFEAMTAQGLPGTPEVDVSVADARADMPVSAIDRYLGDYKVLRILAGWPFADRYSEPTLPDPASEGERIAQDLYHERTSWPEAQERLRQHYRSTGDARGYAHVTRILADAFPFTGTLQFETAAALIELGRPAEAVRYSARSVSLEPRTVNHWLVHAHGLLLTGRKAEGRAALERALALEPGNATARSVLGQLGEG